MLQLHTDTVRIGISARSSSTVDGNDCILKETAKKANEPRHVSVCANKLYWTADNKQFSKKRGSKRRRRKKKKEKRKINENKKEKRT